MSRTVATAPASLRHESASTASCFAARCREFVIFRLTVVVAHSPFRSQPAASFEAVQGRIERPLLYLHDVLRNLLQPLGNRPTVQRLERNGLQYQKIERPLRQLNARLVGQFSCSPFTSTRKG